MRVHELAKKLDKTSKELVAEIIALGGEAKSHMSVVDETILAKLDSSAPAQKEVPKSTQEKSTKKSTPAKAHSKPKEEVKPEPIAQEKVKEQVSASKEPELVMQKDKSGTTKEGVVSLRFPITVGSLATAFKLPISSMIKNLMEIGVFANINQLLNEEIVTTLSEKLEIPIEKLEDETEALIKEGKEEDDKKMVLRPPVVTMMGHVDHGKTSLLDAIRSTNIADREKGAITQHIGAYGVDIPDKGHVTFIDTPGHEAFTSMRARGANVTDVVVLVVAADDGVMPQTIEAVDHAREAGCPIVVAINKSDLPSADPNQVMTGLQKIDLMPEEWGGKTVCVKVSAKTGEGISDLLDMLALESEVLELKANPDRAAVGVVVEGHLSKGSGAVATVLVQKGTLKIGEVIVCGPHMGRVRSMRNDHGKTVKTAGPSYAVEISGLNGVPEAGEKFFVVPDEKAARKITDKINLEQRELDMRGAKKHLSLEDLYNRISEGNFKELKIIIKGDVQGSVEALADSLQKLSTDLCQVRVIHRGAGGINESDVVLSAASDAILIGFHVKADGNAQRLAEKEGVDIRFYGIIYEAVEEIRQAMEGILEPTYEEATEGQIQVRQLFKSSKMGIIAGGMCIKGSVLRKNLVRLIRDNVVIFDGKLTSLKRFKDDVKEVKKGFECGFVLNGFNDVQEGDILEAYRIDKVKTKL